MFLVAPMIWVVLAQAPTSTVPLSGTVSGPDGRPVAGADVMLAGLPPHDPPIVARGKTDDAGRFAIGRPAGLFGDNSSFTPILWVVKPGFRLGYTRLPAVLTGPAEPVRVVLGPPAKAEVRVEAPDGAPVAGARVRVEWFGPQSLDLPDPVEDRLEVKTGPDGRAVVEGASGEDVTYVDVVSDAFGVQGRPFLPRSAGPKRVRLRPTAAIEGRFVADDPAMAGGWKVSAYTRVGDPWGRDPVTTGFAEGTTDDRGRFAFPAIAPGRLQLEVAPPRDLPVLVEIPGSMGVVPGKKNEFEIRLRKAATIAGVVRERGTGRPVAGVEVDLYAMKGGQTISVRTDERGRYALHCRDGLMRISISRTPPTHAPGPGPHWRDIAVPEALGRIETGPFEAIPAAPPLRFVVRDEQGRPAAGASISGTYQTRYMPDRTDERGEIAVPGLPPGGLVAIQFRLGERMTDGPVQATAGTTDPVPATIVPGLALALAGRVLGPGGAPVSGVTVTAQYRDKQENDHRPSWFAQGIGFGDREIQTGPDGAFRTPRELFRKGREYRVEVKAEGYLPGHTEWASTEAGDLITLPDLVLRRSTRPRSVAGRVVDRQGKAIAGASVSSATGASEGPATTDAEGRFRLAGVPGGSAPVFAAKDGFRFGGAIVGPKGEDVEIRLARPSEPPRSIPKPPPPLSRADERALAREWLAPVVPQARAGSLGYLGRSVMPALARVDPDRVLAMIENRAVTAAPDVLDPLVLGQYETDPAAAIATIEADGDPAVRAAGFLTLLDAAPGADRPHRIAWIERALAEARRVEAAESRLGLLGQVADRWLDLGQLDRATSILREGRTIIASLPKDRYSFEAETFAEVMAVMDLRTALTIFRRKGVTNATPADPATIKRHEAEAAVRLATIDPAQAEELAPEDVPNFGDVTESLLRICRRMARADLPRARRILETIDRRMGPAASPGPILEPRGLGLMAAELAETDPAAARKLLDEAFDRLRGVACAARFPGDSPVATAMAELLPAVEAIEPDRLEERLWMTAAATSTIGTAPFLQLLRPSVVQAALVSRYDRAMADALIAPALERLPGMLADAGGLDHQGQAIIRAVAAYDPRAVSAILRALPESARKAPAKHDQWNAASLDAQIRLAAAQAIAWPLPDRWKVVEGDGSLRSYRRAR